MKSTTATTLVGVQSGLNFACSPRWFRQQLLFLDIHDGCIKSADSRGSVQTVRGPSYFPGSFEVLADGGLILGDALRRKIYGCDKAGDLQIADLANEPGHHLSEAIVDSHGGMYVGDIGFDFLDPLVDPVSNGVIFYIGSNGKSSVVAENLLLLHFINNTSFSIVRV